MHLFGEIIMWALSGLGIWYLVSISVTRVHRVEVGLFVSSLKHQIFKPIQKHIYNFTLKTMILNFPPPKFARAAESAGLLFMRL